MPLRAATHPADDVTAIALTKVSFVARRILHDLSASAILTVRVVIFQH
ncbi:MAG: hypothetical protein ABIT38_22420 [Gemmatimonadaceae bacterium]